MGCECQMGKLPYEINTAGFVDSEAIPVLDVLPRSSPEVVSPFIDPYEDREIHVSGDQEGMGWLPLILIGLAGYFIGRRR